MNALIKGQPLTRFTPRMVAQQFYKEGEGLDSNPYGKGTDEYEVFMWEMHKMQTLELERTNDELRAGL